jgi:hypothetical protein
MTYDALLSLRGWGEAEFTRAAPDFLAAARFAVFAERIAAELAAAQKVADTPFKPGHYDRQLVMAKAAAADAIPALKALLFPEDEDG